MMILASTASFITLSSSSSAGLAEIFSYSASHKLGLLLAVLELKQPSL